MLDNKAFYRSITCLVHPASLSAGLILLINSLVLQPQYPSWWTGKLGDFAWMVFVPFFLAVVLSLLIPWRMKHHQSITFAAALGLTALLLILIKTSPFFNTLLVQTVGSITHSAIKLNLDVSDLLALPALGLAWFIWKSSPPEKTFNPGKPFLTFKLAGVIFLMFVVMADAAPPIDAGISCLGRTGDGIIALRKSTFQQKSTWKAYFSNDNGLTWSDAGSLTNSSSSTFTPEEQKINDLVAICGSHPESWVFTDPGNSNINYLFMSGKAIYRSEDQGNNYHIELDTPDIVFLEALVDPVNGSVWVAVGKNGVLLRNSQGEVGKLPLWRNITLQDIEK